MAFKSSSSRIAALPSSFVSNVLLLDAAEPRQQARAAAMRSAGATVQCAATVEAARALWKPGSHQLVLIELEAAGAAFREFYDYARTACARQAFAFYTAEPPYLATAPDARARKRGRGQAGQERGAGESRPSLGQASQRIARARASSRARQAPAPSAGRPSFAEAVRAAEEAVAEKEREPSQQD